MSKFNRKVIENLEPYQKKTKQSAFTKAIQVTSDKQIKKRKRIRRLKIDENNEKKKILKSY